MPKQKLGVLFTLAALASLLLSTLSFADSQARIVRLSDVQGDVKMDRNTGQGFERAFLNLPVTQGAELRAGHDGFAEIEFEDGSTLRIVPGAMVVFSQLALADSGSKLSTMELKQGTAYVSFAGAKDDEFTLNLGSETLTLTTAAHLRVQMGHTAAVVSVFKGDARVGGPAGMVEVGKKQSATFELTAGDQYTLAKNVKEDPYDSWDKGQDEYHQRNLTSAALTSSPNVYGSSDLNYYGSYFNAPGYGMMWQPYLAGAGWDPFMSGLWAFYPGFGYSWVSAYPWGWMPYHSGSWMYLPNYGWAWQPGGAWMGLNNLPRPVNAPSGFVAPLPPSTTARSLVVVNRGPVLAPGFTSAGRVVVRSGSAGLGVPRGSIDNLNKVSQQAQQRGFAAASISTRPSSTVMYSAASSGSGVGYSRATNMPSSSARASAPSFQPAAASAGGAAHSGGSSHK